MSNCYCSFLQERCQSVVNCCRTYCLDTISCNMQDDDKLVNNKNSNNSPLRSSSLLFFPSLSSRAREGTAAKRIKSFNICIIIARNNCLQDGVIDVLGGSTRLPTMQVASVWVTLTCACACKAQRYAINTLQHQSI